MDDASPSPETPPPRRRKAPPEPKKPAIAEKAHDLEAIKKALEDATSVGAGFWLSYLFLMFYIAIAAGAVTHVDLLLENPVKLPFLNVELPLKAFFFLAPILFLIVHMFTLSKLVILSDKARRFHEELSAQIPDAADRDGLRRQLPSNIFVQGLAGPKSARESPFGWLLRAMGWMSMVIAPLLLLLLLELQFLPYHESWLTWVHRLALLADLVLLWWLWRKVLSGDGETAGSAKASVALYGAGGGTTFVALAFAFLVATFPGEWWRPPWSSETDVVFNALPWPKNTLYLSELNIWEALKLDDPKKLDWKDHTANLKERHLEAANFDWAKLGKADLRQAQLQGASLLGAQLQGAWLYEAQLQGASLILARLRGAWLLSAQLQGASLVGAQLQGALLDSAQLQGARLERAQLQGASLDNTQLQGASVQGAQLQGASLRAAELQVTDLRGSFLWRSDWWDAQATQLLTTEWNWRPEASPEGDRRLKPTPWTQERYEALRKSLGDAIPEGARRDAALKRIETLQCKNNVCETPTDAKALQERLEKEAGVDEASYRKALAASFRELLCDGDADAIHILHTVLYVRVIAMGPNNASALVDFITSDKCPVSAALTDDDKSRLRGIKRLAEKKYPTPAPAPAQKPN